VFPLPSWQNGVGVPPSANDGHIGRGVPDVAGNADPNSGYLLTINGQISQVGGTSAVCPLYAGLLALINANLTNPAGYLNPRLYSYGQTPSLGVFRDVADGISNATNGAPGYKSVQGWDACTGWGSIIGTALLNALKPIVCPGALPKKCVSGVPITPLCLVGGPNKPCVSGAPYKPCVAGKQIILCPAGSPTFQCVAAPKIICPAGEPGLLKSQPKIAKPNSQSSDKPTVKRKTAE
jgi:hypothetical protein